MTTYYHSQDFKKPENFIWLRNSGSNSNFALYSNLEILHPYFWFNVRPEILKFSRRNEKMSENDFAIVKTFEIEPELLSDILVNEHHCNFPIFLNIFLSNNDTFQYYKTCSVF